MLHLSRHLLDRIDRKVSVAYLAERAGVTLTKTTASGEELIGRCFLHGAEPASLHILPAVNLWRCERCRVSGSAITWVSHFHAVSRQAAALELLLEFFPGEATELSARKEAHRSAQRRVRHLHAAHA